MFKNCPLKEILDTDKERLVDLRIMDNKAAKGIDQKGKPIDDSPAN